VILSAEIQRRVHIVLDHDHGDLPRNASDQLFHRGALLAATAPPTVSSSSSTLGLCASAMAISRRRFSP